MSAITITEAAHDYLADLLEKQNTTGIGIRIFIAQPGLPLRRKPASPTASRARTRTTSPWR
ncbi:hypothetical protein SSTU70S_00248 [Stutzerimonas stutzeri]